MAEHVEIVTVKIIRVFPRRTKWTPRDALAFVGPPPLPQFRPLASEVQAVHISVAFTWDIPLAANLQGAWEQQYASKVLLSGPAYGTYPREFVPGMYLHPGVTITTRGCNNDCPYCQVPWREGKLREMDPIPPGFVVQDNNFLQASPAHRASVYQMLNRQRQRAVFAGGLEPHLVTEAVADELRGVCLEEVFLSADREDSMTALRTAVQRLSFLRMPCEDRAGEPARHIRCYVLVGFQDETPAQAEARLERVWEAGAMPFLQLYQPPDRYIDYRQERGAEWMQLQHKWTRIASMVASHKKEDL